VVEAWLQKALGQTILTQDQSTFFHAEHIEN